MYIAIFSVIVDYIRLISGEVWNIFLNNPGDTMLLSTSVTSAPSCDVTDRLIGISNKFKYVEKEASKHRTVEQVTL